MAPLGRGASCLHYAGDRRNKPRSDALRRNAVWTLCVPVSCMTKL